MTFNFDEYLPYVIDTYSAILGEEYREIIKEKIYDMKICFYTNIDGELDYISNLKLFRKKELLKDFLNAIGLKNNKKINKQIVNILNNNVTSLFETNSKDELYLTLKYFNNDDFLIENQLFDKKILLINFLLNREDINNRNYYEFRDSAIYFKLLESVNKILNIYLEYYKKYVEYDKRLFAYETYLFNEKEECNKTKTNEIKFIFDKFYSLLPKYIKDNISNYTTNEQYDIFFLDENCNIFIFQSSFMRDLYEKHDGCIPLNSLVIYQNAFLKKLGFDVPELDYSSISDNDITKHIEFLNDKNAKGQLFDFDNVDRLLENYKIASYLGVKKYHMNKDYYINFINENHNLEDIKSISAYEMVNKSICVICTKDISNKLCTLLYFGIDKNMFGSLSLCFLHECGHAIDQRKFCCGFDKFNEEEFNSFNHKYRKYERFNETITDMLAIEAIYYLEGHNIFMFEEKKYVDSNRYHNLNTSDINKKILFPLIKKYRKYVIEAKVMSDASILTKYIGESNYEELVFLLNWVDNLYDNGLNISLKNKSNDNLTNQYYLILKRKEDVYQKIDIYYSKVMTRLSL
jgi:hypothetical protein